VTEGARVRQVGVELPKRAVVRVVMWWLSEPKHPLGCVSSAEVVCLQMTLPNIVTANQ
jgi:hypothetical protein